MAGADAQTRKGVSDILEGVLARGDAAVREYTLRFDGVDLAPEEWELEAEAWQSALGRMPPPLRAA